MNDEDEFFDSNNHQYQKLRRILRAMGQTDEMIQDKFVLKRHRPIGGGIHAQGDDDEEITGVDADMDEFRDSILLNSIDRMGDPVNEARKALNDENNLRYSNGIKLLISKKECIQYLENLGKNTELGKVRNWFRFCVSMKLYQKLKTEYYYVEEEFKNACEEVGINSASSYKKRYFKDPRLPSLKWIEAGFYEEMKNGFTISNLFDIPVWTEY